MNFAASPTVNVWPSTPGLYFARMSCTGIGPLGGRLRHRPVAALAALRDVQLRLRARPSATSNSAAG